MVSSCTIVPTRLFRGGVGGSITAIAVSVVIGGVVGTGGGVEAVNILGAVGGVRETFGAIAIHHVVYLLSFLSVYIITDTDSKVNRFLC